jgi:hypothetical protein
MAGDHLVEFRRSGYERVLKRISVPTAEPLRVTLKPLALAQLVVKSEPSDALVYLNGAQVGRTPCTLTAVQPGRHDLKIVATNYFPQEREVRLEAGAPVTVSLTLENRQERAYRQRIKADPHDVAAYNDLGEFLYVQERYEDAAEVYVAGLIRAGDSGHAWNTRDRQNLKRLDKEPRSRHLAPGFQQALNRKEIAAVRDGESSDYLFRDFMRIPSDQRGTAWGEAVEQYIERHRDSVFLLFRLAPLCQQAGDVPRTVRCLDRIAALHSKRADSLLKCMTIGVELYRRKSDKAVRHCLLRLQSRLEQLSLRATQARELSFRLAILLLVEKRWEEGEASVREALAGETNWVRANDWRIQASELLLAGKRSASVVEFLKPIAQTRGLARHQWKRYEVLRRRLSKADQKKLGKRPRKR